ncbi:TIGR04083 family peptide-modifying radical SAM enzyme [Methanobrevibacter filiformis]|uniref:Anaerobic sulfatase-maturating enzyme n=1 Tax=Methanobrevibacter filiformis TaxID=55758 RepID=A0A166EWM3_9EURY|nr:TIGR04083 family peptide-modifying radical SAM enzyme [Methanobrevibacter filiformis]KZX17091.1 anaerobic sulfatase-maturating enzyme [Methanobrevibacter filiformis]
MHSQNKKIKNGGFSLQSNLWLLTPELAKLFAKYNIAISTSIDGPKEINDYQRGEGYFDKTMNAYEIAKKNGIKTSFVCTFTSYSKDFKDEIYEFFLKNEASIKLHGALPSLRGDNADKWALTTEEHGQILIDLLDKYLYDLDKFEIKDFDHICKSSFLRRGTLCTFADCIGDTLAIGHDGKIYPCYRFVGMEDYVLGNVQDNPSMKEIMKTSAWGKLEEFREYVKENCKDCTYTKFCNGGCPYNAIVSSKTPKSVDPQCEAYKIIFKEVSDRLNKEFLSSSLPPMFTSNTQQVQEAQDENKKKKYSIKDLMFKK